MSINKSWLALLLIFAPALFASPELADSVAEADAVRREQKGVQRANTEARRMAENITAESEVAIARIRAACIPVVAEDTGETTRLSDRMPVKMPGESRVTFDDGSLVCTSLGDTAEVLNGRVYNVKRAAPKDQEIYDQLFSQQKGTY